MPLADAIVVQHILPGFAMTTQLNLRLLSAYSYASRTASVIVIVVGISVLLGWLLNIPQLTSILPGFATMKANSALAFVLAGLSLWLSQTERENDYIDLISKGSAALAALIGLLTLWQYVFNQDLGIDQLLLNDTQTAQAVYPGRMSPVTAVTLSVLGFALLILDRRQYRWPVEVFGFGALLSSVFALMGYSYGVPSFYDFFPYSSIAIHTAVTLLFLSLGILFARPEHGLMKIFSSDDVGGEMARRLMPGAIVVPFVLGWLLLTGQRMGLYDSTFRLVLFAISSVIVFTVLILWNARLLQHADLIRKQTQKQLIESREAEVELQNAKRELEAANKELEAFSYSVSHDLRSPLRSIDGFSRALQEDYGELLPPEGHRFLEHVRSSTHRMAELIDDLLKLSQVTRAQINLRTVDLTRLAESILSELQQTYAERNVAYRVAPSLSARGDPRLVEVVLENLLNNAWKYTSKQEQAEIEFGAKREDGQTIFFVRDNGAGFDMAYASKLFGAFQRLHTTTEFPGTGIGLATVQRILHRHGGRIWADAAVDEGATFFFTLPAVEAARAETEPQETDSIVKRAKEIV